MNGGWGEFFAVCTVSVACTVFFCYRFGMGTAEKEFVRGKLAGLLKIFSRHFTNEHKRD